MICNADLYPNYFHVNVSALAIVFRRQISIILPEISALRITLYLSIALSKILPHSKIRKNAKKLSVFGENDSRHLPNFLQSHIFWNFDHISRIDNKIYYRNIWFAKEIIILIMTAQVLFFNFFFRKRRAPYLFISFHFILCWQNTYEFKYYQKLLAMQKIRSMLIKVN